VTVTVVSDDALDTVPTPADDVTAATLCEALSSPTLVLVPANTSCEVLSLPTLALLVTDTSKEVLSSPTLVDVIADTLGEALSLTLVEVTVTTFGDISFSLPTAVWVVSADTSCDDLSSSPALVSVVI